MAANSTGQISVYIAEDHAVVRSGVKLILNSDPTFNVIGEAADGETAFNQISQLVPQVALVDIGLPVVDGITLSGKLKSGSVPTKIVMFTSHESSEEVLAAFAAGVEGYCLKEATESQIRTALKSVAEGAFWLHPTVAQSVLTQSTLNKQQPQGAPQFKLSYDTLSEREHEVLRILVAGSSNQQIAEELILSLETVKTHIRHIFEKLAVADRTQAALTAVRAGWIK
jgi:DNA-binding NarL/FixJ family response regulator